MRDVEEMIITLTFEDEEVECAVLHVFDVNGFENQKYIALISLDEDEDSDEVSIFLFHLNETADNGFELSDIEDDKEYELAKDTLDSWLDSQDFEDFQD